MLWIFLKETSVFVALKLSWDESHRRWAVPISSSLVDVEMMAEASEVLHWHDIVERAS